MPRRIAVANQKGGVAKTTTTVNLAAYIGALDKRVLLIDLDPQANATSGMGIDKDSVEQSVYDAIIGDREVELLIRKTELPNVDVLPANLALVGAEIELVNAERREVRLAEALSRSPRALSYDYILMDTPPSLGLLTINAMTAADSILIPMQCEYYALEGLAQLYKTIQLVRQRTNPQLAIEGLVFSMVDPRSNLTVQVMAEVKKFLKEKVYETVIPRNIRLAEAPGFGKPILLYDKLSRGAEAYKKLAAEFISRHPAPTTEPASETAARMPTENKTPTETTV
jgi:chromosome partitioning protein